MVVIIFQITLFKTEKSIKPNKKMVKRLAGIPVALENINI